MLWRGLTPAEAKLPEECQLPALRARRRSWRIRIHIAVLLALYTGWVGFQIVASLYNTQRESKDAFARKWFLRIPLFVMRGVQGSADVPQPALVSICVRATGGVGTKTEWQAAWCCLEVVKCVAGYLVWSFSTSGKKSLQIGALLIPRLLVQLLAFFTTASFLGWLLFFKDEPAEFRMKHFLPRAEYPTVCMIA